jgi:hypothetical protein
MELSVVTFVNDRLHAEPINGSGVCLRHVLCGARDAPSLTRVILTFGDAMQKTLKPTYTAPKSDRGCLVRKYWERKHSSEVKDALGRDGGGRGIYVLYRGKRVYYVGLSKVSMRSRLRSHAKSKRHRGKWDHFSFYQIGKRRYIKEVESLLLRIIKPRGNDVSGKFPRKHNLARNR